MEDIKKLFEELGFTLYESKILLWLIAEGGLRSAKQISQGSNVPLTRIYSILLGFEKKGMIKVTPGKEKLYSTADIKHLIEILKNNKKSELEEKEEKDISIINSLNQKLKDISKGYPSEVAIKYYTDNNAYWEDYAAASQKMKSGEKNRIINNLRLCHSFIQKELDAMSETQRDVMKGKFVSCKVKMHYVVNPRSLVQRAVSDLKDKNDILMSITRMLKNVKRENAVITIAPELKNLVMVIFSDMIFLEFYGEDSKKITSAIQIKSEQITKDFAGWFDAFDKRKKHNLKEEYKEFENEILKWAEKLAGISPRKILLA